MNTRRALPTILCAALSIAGCNALLGLEDGILTEPCDPASPDTCSPADGCEDEGCPCDAGATAACAYGGPPGTEGAGVCRAGARSCGADGLWGACDGEVVPRPENCATQADESCDGLAGCGEVVSGVLLGGSGDQWATAIAADGHGGAIVGGGFTDRLDFGGGEITTSATPDAFVARVDGGGAVAWALPLVKSGTATLRAIAHDPGAGDLQPEGIVIAGEFDGTIELHQTHTAGAPSGFLAKLDMEGRHVWSLSCDAIPAGVTVTSSGHVLVTSVVSGCAGCQDADIQLAWYSGAQGEPVGGAGNNEKVLVGAGSQPPPALAAKADGNALLAGVFQDALQFGNQALEGAGQQLFVAVVDGHGDLVQGYPFAGGEPEARHAVVGADGAVTLSGTFAGSLGFGDPEDALETNGGTSAFIAKLAADGAHVFSRSLGGKAPPAVALDAEGGVLLAGDLDGTLDLGGAPLASAPGAVDLYVARLDPQGGHVWSRQLGAPAGVRQAAGIALVGGSGHLVIAATAEGPIDLPQGQQTADGKDVLLVRLAP